MSGELRRFVEEHDLELPDCPDCGDPLTRWDPDAGYGVCRACDQYVIELEADR